MAKSGDSGNELGIEAASGVGPLTDHRLAYGIGRAVVGAWFDRVKATFRDLAPDKHVGTPGKTGIVYLSGAQLVESGKVYGDMSGAKVARRGIIDAVDDMARANRAIIARSGFNNLKRTITRFQGIWNRQGSHRYISRSWRCPVEFSARYGS